MKHLEAKVGAVNFLESCANQVRYETYQEEKRKSVFEASCDCVN